MGRRRMTKGDRDGTQTREKTAPKSRSIDKPSPYLIDLTIATVGCRKGA